ncbi:MAG: NAD-binding protein, partial [Rhabdochlamydiaceae bacterium]
MVLAALAGVAGGFGAILFRFMISAVQALFFSDLLPSITLFAWKVNLGIILLLVIGGGNHRARGLLSRPRDARDWNTTGDGNLHPGGRTHQGTDGHPQGNSLGAVRLENHVIVMGYDLLGVYVVDKLKEMGLSYVVIVRDESRLPDLLKSHVTALATPMAKSFETLKTAGASKASAIIATFDDDGDNLLSILNAKKINPNSRAIIVINDRDMVEAASASGAEVVLTPYELTGQLLALSTVSKRTSALFVKGSFKENHISEFVIDGDGKATYRDLSKIAPILMVSRKGATTVNPKEEFGIERGDIIYTLTDTSSLIALEDELIKRRMTSSSHDKSASGERQLARSGGSEEFSS